MRRIHLYTQETYYKWYKVSWKLKNPKKYIVKFSYQCGTLFSLSARNLLVQLANKNLRRNYATCVHATSKFSAKLTYGRRTRDSTFILGRFFQGTNPISPSHQDEGWQWVGRGRRWVGVTDIIWVFAVCMCVRGSWTIVWALFKGCGYEYRAKSVVGTHKLSQVCLALVWVQQTRSLRAACWSEIKVFPPTPGCLLLLATHPLRSTHDPRPTSQSQSHSTHSAQFTAAQQQHVSGEQ